MTSDPLTSYEAARVWVISDGRAGIEAPALGLAEALGLGFAVHHVEWPGWLNLTEAVLPYDLLRRFFPLPDGAPPRLAIGAGRRAVPTLRGLRRLGVATVFLGDPRCALHHFNLVIAPTHDRLSGANVHRTLGSLHRITPDKCTAALAKFADLLAPLESPRLAVLVGGKSRRHDLPENAAFHFALRLARLCDQGFGLMVTTSRRTPLSAVAILRAALGERENVIWYDGTGDNPYLAFLAAADGIIVTSDSVNMASEAASTGKPVLVVDLPGQPGKIGDFHARLRAGGYTRALSDPVRLWTSRPLDDMGPAVARVRALLEVGAATP